MGEYNNKFDYMMPMFTFYMAIAYIKWSAGNKCRASGTHSLSELYLFQQQVTYSANERSEKAVNVTESILCENTFFLPAFHHTG